MYLALTFSLTNLAMTSSVAPTLRRILSTCRHTQMNDRDYWKPHYLPISKLRSAVASLPLARYCRSSCLGPEWRARERVICACAEFISYLDIPISMFDFRIRCSIFSYSTFDFRIRYSIKRIRCSISAFDI